MNQSFKINLYLSVDSVFDSNNELVKEIRVDAMQANGFFDISLNTMLKNFEAGDYLIGVVDSLNEVAEYDGSNNTVYHVIPTNNTVYQSITKSGHIKKGKRIKR